jgi:hypothetical protein
MYQPSQRIVTNEHVGADVLICPVERKLDRVFDGIESSCARLHSRGRLFPCGSRRPCTSATLAPTLPAGCGPAPTGARPSASAGR